MPYLNNSTPPQVDDWLSAWIVHHIKCSAYLNFQVSPFAPPHIKMPSYANPIKMDSRDAKLLNSQAFYM
jgi:hypothetical protein